MPERRPSPEQAAYLQGETACLDQPFDRVFDVFNSPYTRLPAYQGRLWAVDRDELGLIGYKVHLKLSDEMGRQLGVHAASVRPPFGRLVKHPLSGLAHMSLVEGVGHGIGADPSVVRAFVHHLNAAVMRAGDRFSEQNYDFISAEAMEDEVEAQREEFRATLQMRLGQARQSNTPYLAARLFNRMQRAGLHPRRLAEFLGEKSDRPFWRNYPSLAKGLFLSDWSIEDQVAFLHGLYQFRTTNPGEMPTDQVLTGFLTSAGHPQATVQRGFQALRD